MKVEFLGVELDIEFTKYAENGNTAIVLKGEEGSIFTVATVNTGRQESSNVVGIKNYGENTGIVKSLQDAGVITDKVVREEASGYVKIPYYELTVAAEKERKKQFKQQDL